MQSRTAPSATAASNVAGRPWSSIGYARSWQQRVPASQRVAAKRAGAARPRRAVRATPTRARRTTAARVSCAPKRSPRRATARNRRATRPRGAGTRGNALRRWRAANTPLPAEPNLPAMAGLASPRRALLLRRLERAGVELPRAERRVLTELFRDSASCRSEIANSGEWPTRRSQARRSSVIADTGASRTSCTESSSAGGVGYESGSVALCPSQSVRTKRPQMPSPKLSLPSPDSCSNQRSSGRSASLGTLHSLGVGSVLQRTGCSRAEIGRRARLASALESRQALPGPCRQQVSGW